MSDQSGMGMGRADLQRHWHAHTAHTPLLDMVFPGRPSGAGAWLPGNSTGTEKDGIDPQ